jgi:hypothetical protein
LPVPHQMRSLVPQVMTAWTSRIVGTGFPPVEFAVVCVSRRICR